MNGILNTILYFVISTLLSTGAAAVIEDTPAEVTETYFADLASGQQQIIREYQDSDSAEQIEAETLKGLDFKIEDAMAKGDVAVAKVAVTNRDFSGVGEVYKKESYDYVMEHLYDEDITDKDNLSEKCLKIYEEAVAEAAENSEEVSAEIFLPMVKNQEDDWQVILDNETRSALMGGIMLPGADGEEAKADNRDAKAEKLDMADMLRQSTVDYVLEQEEIPAYSYNQIWDMDMSIPSGVSVEDLKLVTSGNLVGLEEDFWQCEQDNNVNCLFVMGIASLESANGTICFRPNNMFGYGGSGFSSKAEGIRVVSKALANSYLDPSGSLYNGHRITDVNKRYAASSTWDEKVCRNMTRYYSVISENHNKQLEKLK